MDRALGVVHGERGVKIALGHVLGGALVVVLVLAAHLRQFRRAVLVFQNAEHAAAIDARKLAVVADHDELCARRVGVTGELRHELGVDHGRFVEDDHGLVVPARPAGIEPEKLAVDRGGAGEAVGAHVFGHGVRGREANNLVATRGVRLANGGNGEALSGSGLAVDDGETARLGGVNEGVGLFAADACEFRAA